MNGEHNYKLTIKWTGNKGTGTSTYRSTREAIRFSLTTNRKFWARQILPFMATKRGIIRKNFCLRRYQHAI